MQSVKFTSPIFSFSSFMVSTWKYLPPQLLFFGFLYHLRVWISWNSHVTDGETQTMSGKNLHCLKEVSETASDINLTLDHLIHWRHSKLFCLFFCVNRWTTLKCFHSPACYKWGFLSSDFFFFGTICNGVGSTMQLSDGICWKKTNIYFFYDFSATDSLWSPRQLPAGPLSAWFVLTW